MNNAKGTAAKKTTKGTTKQSAKSTQSKVTSSNGNAAKKSKAATPETAATKGKVFRVDVKKGPIREISRKSAIEDALQGGQFNAETLNEELDKGKVIFSESFYYATDRKALAKWEKEIEAAPEPAPIKAGDKVFHQKKNVIGTVVGEGKDLMVKFVLNGKDQATSLNKNWVLSDGTETALTVPEPIVPEVVEEKPLTKSEQKELADREAVIETAKTQFENAPMVMGAELDVIRSKRLYRDTDKTFGEYAFRRFGFTREYAHNLALISGYHAIMEESLKESEQLQISVRATNQLMQSTNRVMRDLGVERSEGFEEMRPVIKNVTRLLVDSAPKDADGNPDISPRFLSVFDEKLREIINSGVVHLEGQAMTVAEASKKGIALDLFRNEVIEGTAESLLKNKQAIRDLTQQTWERQQQQAAAEKEKAPRGPKVYFAGTTPELAVHCDKHGGTKIVSIGSGKIQTGCKCRWLIDAESGKLVCFEVNGKPVKRA